MFEEKYFLKFFISALILNVVVYAYPDYNPYSDPGNPSYTSGFKNDYRTDVPDQDLAKQIRDKISSGWFVQGYDRVTVQVHEGVVILGGSVDSWTQKDQIERGVRAMNGVKSLNSRIEVHKFK